MCCVGGSGRFRVTPACLGHCRATELLDIELGGWKAAQQHAHSQCLAAYKRPQSFPPSLPNHWTQDPKKRATAEQILQHPWMKENGVASDKPLDNVILKRMG